MNMSNPVLTPFVSSKQMLALFGTAMAISFGLKSPLDYSVFSASAAALLLATCQSRREGGHL